MAVSIKRASLSALYSLHIRCELVDQLNHKPKPPRCQFLQAPNVGGGTLLSRMYWILHEN